MDVYQMAADIKRRFGAEVVFRRISNPAALKGQIGLIGAGLGAMPIHGLGIDERTAYDDAVERQMQAYDWVVTNVDEDDLARLLKKDYAMRDAKERGYIELIAGSLFISTRAVNHFDLMSALRRAKIEHGDVNLE